MYGIHIPEQGTIEDGYRAFYLSEHGRATENGREIVPMVHPKIYRYKRSYQGEYVLAFVELEKNNSAAACCMLETFTSYASAFSPGNYMPYFYIYTTKKPDPIPNRDYGIEIYNGAGDTVFTNSHKTLTVLPLLSLPLNGSATITSPNGVNVTNRRIAISNAGVGLIYAPSPYQLRRGVTVFKRVNNTIKRENSDAGRNQSNSQSIAQGLNRSIGLPEDLRNINIGVSVIDVTGIR